MDFDVDNCLHLFCFLDDKTLNFPPPLSFCCFRKLLNKYFFKLDITNTLYLIPLPIYIHFKNTIICNSLNLFLCILFILFLFTAIYFLLVYLILIFFFLFLSRCLLKTVILLVSEFV